MRTLKEPPDIWDLVHENNSSFHAGSAFFTRITSIKAKTLLAVASILVGALCAFVALNWKALIDRIQPAAVVPSSSAQIVSDAKPPVVNRAAPDASNSQTAAAQQAVSDAVSSSAPAASSGVAGVEATTGTQASVPASPAIGSYRALRRTKRSLDAVEPAQDIAEKPKSPEKSDTTTTSNRPASNAPAAKATVNGGNSQLIERPSGTATPKPKTIQWP